MMTLLRKIQILGLMLLVSACETVKLAPDGETQLQRFNFESAEDQYQQRKKIDQLWQISGKFSFSSSADSGQGRFKWQRELDKDIQDKVRLFGPFGAGVVTMEVGKQGASIKNGNNIRTASSLEQLSLDALGWMLPYSELQYWMFGLPVNNTPAWVAYDESQRLSIMKQSGWNIELNGEKRVSLPDGTQLVLPKKISANHLATQTKVKLLVSSLKFD